MQTKPTRDFRTVGMVVAMMEMEQRLLFLVAVLSVGFVSSGCSSMLIHV
jgi:hypothetical protein